MESLVHEIIYRLRDRQMTLGAVESATGGLISNLITSVPGCSVAYLGSIVSYSNDVKMRVVGVSAATLEKYGAVSAPVARQMAAGGRKVLGVDICVADTGVAGPGGASLEKPVGLFYVGLSTPEGTHSRRCLYTGTREENKMSAALDALEWVAEYLKRRG